MALRSLVFVVVMYLARTKACTEWGIKLRSWSDLSSARRAASGNPSVRVFRIWLTQRNEYVIDTGFAL